MSDQQSTNAKKDDINPTPSRAWSETTFHESSISYMWVIKNFSIFLTGNEQCIKSATFSSEENTFDKNKWCLELFPKGVNQTLKDLSLYLRLLSTNENNEDKQVTANYVMFIMNDKDEFEPRVAEKEVIKEGCTTIKSERFIGMEELMDRKNEFLPGDTLTLLCVVTTVMKTREAFVSECATLRIPDCRIHHDLSCLFESKDFSDVIVVSAGGTEFSAHKAIIGARSPVFAAMFKTEMSECMLSRVEIADVDSDVISEMLRYIYTGTAKNLEKVAAELLVAADMYELNGLQSICAKWLSESITVQNSAEYLVLADMHHEEGLKQTAIDFILGHFEEVKKSQGWMMMTKNHPQLIFEYFLFKPDSVNK